MPSFVLWDYLISRLAGFQLGKCFKSLLVAVSSCSFWWRWESKLDEAEREELRWQKKRAVPVELKKGILKGEEPQPCETKYFLPAC